MQVNEEKRKKFMEYAGKRVNNVLHDIQILEPMSRSTSYDFTRQDVEEMFSAMQETLNNTKAEFERKFEEKARSEKKVFSFGTTNPTTTTSVVDTIPTTYEYETETTIPTTETYSTTDVAYDTTTEGTFETVETVETTIGTETTETL